MDQIFFFSGVSGIFSPFLVEKFWIPLFLILYYLNILLFLKNRSSWIWKPLLSGSHG